MAKCPWCEKYIESYLRRNDELAEQERESENIRVSGGFWATIGESENEEVLANENLDAETAFALGRTITIDMRSGGMSSHKYNFYSLAEVRDKALNLEAKHFWIQSGACSMSFLTPICCEIANWTSAEEALEQEMQEPEFQNIRALTEAVKQEIDKEL